MKIHSLSINNFRQFYGEATPLKFYDENKRFAVIHASNGAGKTAILNAFSWVLYGKVTAGFRNSHQLVNKRAIYEAEDGARVLAEIKLEFSHDGKRYLLERETEAFNEGGRPKWTSEENRCPSGKAILQYCGDDGDWQPESYVDDTISNILPRDLYRYFFLDGETLSAITKPNEREQRRIGSAIKRFLNIKILDRSITHLERAKLDLQRELRKIGDPETQKLIEQSEKVTAEKTDKEEALEKLEQEISSCLNNIMALENRLRGLEAAADQQKRSDDLKEASERARQELKVNLQQQATLLEQFGYMQFLDKPVGFFKEHLKHLRQIGTLPAGIKEQFVEDRLEQEICICGRGLSKTDDPDARKAVEAFKDQAGQTGTEENAFRMQGQIIVFQNSQETFEDGSTRFKNAEEEIRKNLSNLEREWEELQGELQESDEQDIAELALRLKAFRDDLSGYQSDKGALEAKIEALQEQLDEIDQKIEKHQGKEENQKLAQRRVSAVTEAIRLFKESKNNFEIDIREKLQSTINDIWQDISQTPYIVELKDNYTLELQETTGEVHEAVGESKGEGQILTFCFLQAIMLLQKTNVEELGARDTEYPVVLDAIWGALDPEHRTKLARHLTKEDSFPQVVLLLHEGHWRGEVSGVLTQGELDLQQYVLSYFSSRSSAEESELHIEGTEYPLVSKSTNGYEYSEIIQVSQ